ncbi:MAG: hypothetical protein KF732_11850 [Flavobacteriales bacterium]|nr:hypothetical protein [Flavobacteriales bacterium]
MSNKKLEDLSLIEFLQLISGFNKIYKYQINLKSIDNGNDIIKRTQNSLSIDQLKEVSDEMFIPEIEDIIKEIENSINIIYSQFDIYKYLKKLTDDFGIDEVKMVLDEMSTFEYNQLYPLMNILAYEKYLLNNWEVPFYNLTEGETINLKDSYNYKDNYNYDDIDEISNRIYFNISNINVLSIRGNSDRIHHFDAKLMRERVFPFFTQEYYGVKEILHDKLESYNENESLELDIQPKHNDIFCNKGFELFEYLLQNFVKPKNQKGHNADILFCYHKLFNSEPKYINQRIQPFLEWYEQNYDLVIQNKTYDEVKNLNREKLYSKTLELFKLQK